MKKLTIDFDGTLCVTAFPAVGRRRAIHKMIAWYVNRKHEQGWFVILNTLREYQNDTLTVALEAMDKWGIKFDAVNANYQPDVVKYGVDSRKIGTNLNIDDKNFGLFGWLLRRLDK